MIKAFSQDEINEREAAIVLLDHERREIAKELTELPYCHCGNMHDYERSAGRAKPGWGNVVDNAMLSIKYQPERVGFLTIFTFFDTLAALDPKRQYDAAFASPADSELWWAFAQPQQALTRWEAKGLLPAKLSMVGRGEVFEDPANYTRLRTARSYAASFGLLDDIGGQGDKPLSPETIHHVYTCVQEVMETHGHLLFGDGL
ncbi:MULTISPECIES: hypothetical protein [unclassified Rhizobium]|uniref:hypothetical protein n=1 Tax=unclassified Rhizobium TaxID=2613769 RepID=UPI000BD90ABF|nr:MULTISPECIES: hypothetical protein [unclassified Rhizobium]MDH7804894.1 hypothetical protein [Rhizobium sp. AN67]SOD56282.1 hypothetical protein SAMN05216595_2993 [Rhizobium sp. AN6A]